MLWGYFSRVGPLLTVKGTLNTSAYQEVLDSFKNFEEQFGVAPSFPVHKARSLKTWVSRFCVRELDWPAQTPYLNPVGGPLG